MTVTCSTCGAEHDFPAQKGWRLADARSPCCGAMLRGARAGVPHVSAGRGQGTCELCRHQQYRNRLVDVPGGIWRAWPLGLVGRLGETVRICDWHRLYPRGVLMLPPGGVRAAVVAGQAAIVVYEPAPDPGKHGAIDLRD